MLDARNRIKLNTLDFPRIYRGALENLQVNLGYLCNQSCAHCHVNAGPNRKELMDRQTVDLILSFLESSRVKVLDLTGGAPEMNPHFTYLVEEASSLGVHVMDRCNLTILEMPDYEYLANFLAEHKVEVTASLPCYLSDNVDEQRGRGVFEKSISALKKLNRLGYARQPNLKLNLVYNPKGPTLPPPQGALESDYKVYLKEHFGIEFNQLFTITNMPIARFAAQLVSKKQLEPYIGLLKDHFNEQNLAGLMCRNTLSVDWQGYLYDCDFNQMLGLTLGGARKESVHISEIHVQDLKDSSIAVADHCFGCTAGHGSSCTGAMS